MFKTNSDENKNMALFVKASLLKHCHSMNIRTDLADSGIYIFKYWILKLLEELEKEEQVSISSIHVSHNKLTL